jgi:hypothetical protein
LLIIGALDGRLACVIEKEQSFFTGFISKDSLRNSKERKITRRTTNLLVAMAVIVLLLAVPFFAGPAKAITAAHETVDIQVNSASLCILVINPANGQEAGYTSLAGSEIDTFVGAVYAIVVSPQEVQLCSYNGFEGSNAINFNIEVFDPPASFTLTVTHFDNSGNNVYGSPGTWSGTLNAGGSYTAYAGISEAGNVINYGGALFSLPEYALGGLLALGAGLAACVVFNKRKSLPLFKKN